MKRRIFYPILCFLILIAVVSGNRMIHTACAANLSKVTVSSAVTLKVNEKKRLKVKKVPAKATVTYKSQNRSIASVDSRGYIKGERQGRTAVTVKIMNGEKSIIRRCSVTVEKKAEKTEEKTKIPAKKINIQVGSRILTATLVQNSSTKALMQMLSDGPVTIQMSDYADMEKVGRLPQSLPRNDEQIQTDFGDLILYQGNSFVIYYDQNSWNFTRLGKIDNISETELKKILGDGSVSVTLSLP